MGGFPPSALKKLNGAALTVTIFIQRRHPGDGARCNERDQHRIPAAGMFTFQVEFHPNRYARARSIPISVFEMSAHSGILSRMSLRGGEHGRSFLNLLFEVALITVGVFLALVGE